MSTAHKTAAEIKEHYESDADLYDHAKTLAQWIRASKHVVFFTGAGISTSAGIPDFRGPEGVWTLRAQGKVARGKTTSTKAMPTATHMAISELIRLGAAQSVISQNTDGLHRKSGVPPDKIAELHGNTNLERCKKCGTEYMRDFRTRDAHGVHDHATSRRCDDPKCRGVLLDSIINFSENLPERDISMGFHEAEKSDLCICMGSSLRVTPAADMPERVAERGEKLVIVNLQKTPFDKICSMRVFGKCDEFMHLVMKELDIPIPAWELHRILKVELKAPAKSESLITVRLKGVDVDGKAMSFIKACQFDGVVKNSEPFEFSVDRSKSKNRDQARAHAQLQFFGHYNEPQLDVSFSLQQKSQLLFLTFDPLTGVWRIDEKVKEEEEEEEEKLAKGIDHIDISSDQ